MEAPLLAVRRSIRSLPYVRCRKAFKLLGIGSEAVKVLRYRSDRHRYNTDLILDAGTA
jgi:hypothetical protein